MRSCGRLLGAARLAEGCRSGDRDGRDVREAARVAEPLVADEVDEAVADRRAGILRGHRIYLQLELLL